MIMEYLNKKVLVVNVAMLLILLMGFSAAVKAAGHLNQSPSYNISQFLGNGGDAITPPGMRRWRYHYEIGYPKASFENRGDDIIPDSRRRRRFQILDAHSSTKKKDCCDSCDGEILYSIQYKCKDVWESSCPPSCPASYCHCDKSHPPQCQCLLVALDKCPIPTCS